MKRLSLTELCCFEKLHRCSCLYIFVRQLLAITGFCIMCLCGTVQCAAITESRAMCRCATMAPTVHRATIAESGAMSRCDTVQYAAVTEPEAMCHCGTVQSSNIDPSLSSGIRVDI